MSENLDSWKKRRGIRERDSPGDETETEEKKEEEEGKGEEEEEEEEKGGASFWRR